MRARVDAKLARRSPSASRPSASERRAKSSCTIDDSAFDTRANRRVMRRAMNTAMPIVATTVATPAAISTTSSWPIAASNCAWDACAAFSALSREKTTITAPTTSVSATIGTANPAASWAPSRNFMRSTPLEKLRSRPNTRRCIKGSPPSTRSSAGATVLPECPAARRRYRARAGGLFGTAAHDGGRWRVPTRRGERRKMPFSARVLLDSVSPAGVRLTTMEARYPRFIHSELLTHRVFSRNSSSSSRAVPIRKMIDAVRTDPAMPVWWGRNQAGMQAFAELERRRARARASGVAARARGRARARRTPRGVRHQLAQAAGEPHPRTVRVDHGHHHRDGVGELLHAAHARGRAARAQAPRDADARRVPRAASRARSRRRVAHAADPRRRGSRRFRWNSG